MPNGLGLKLPTTLYQPPIADSLVNYGMPAWSPDLPMSPSMGLGMRNISEGVPAYLPSSAFLNQSGASPSGGIFDNFFSRTENGVTQQGWGGMALGAAQALGNAFMGMKQYGLAKDMLRTSKDQFERNYAAQRQLTNTALEDRARARYSANPNAYERPEDYMAKHGVR